MEASRVRNQFETEMRDLSDQNVEELWSLWHQMGIPDLQGRMASVTEYIRDAFKRMVEEEHGHLDDLLKQIEKYERERACLLEELGEVDKSGNGDHTHLTYIEIFNDCKQQVDALRAAKEIRMVEVNELRADDERASIAVDSPPYPLPAGKIPTTQRMNDVKDHIKEMKNLKKSRSSQFERAKGKILELYDELEAEPNTTFERRIICGQNEDFIYSTTNMNTIEKMLGTLQNQLEKNREMMIKMLQRIKVLCSRLSFETEKRKEYLPSDPVGYSDRRLKEVSLKLDELEELKKTFLSQFVEASRNELRGLWESCFYGKAQRNAFTPIHATEFDEHILDEHEKEVDRLRVYYEQNKELFQKINEWNLLWNKKVELDNRQRDPNRLFNHRKNNLLQEEKERKAVERQFPKVEMELKEKVSVYESQNGKSIKIYGFEFEEYIQEQKSDHGEEMNLEKMQRKDMKRRIVEHETRYGTGLRPLTPINNMTTTLMKNRRMDTPNKSRITPMRSTVTKKFGTAEKLSDFHSNNKRRANENDWPKGKKIRMDEHSIIAGNLQTTKQSVASNLSYKENDVVSSTFCTESKLYPGSSATFRKTPVASGVKSSTPRRANIRTPVDTNIFKTPSSRPRMTPSRQNDTKNRTLRSGRKVPFKL